MSTEDDVSNKWYVVSYRPADHELGVRLTEIMVTPRGFLVRDSASDRKESNFRATTTFVPDPAAARFFGREPLAVAYFTGATHNPLTDEADGNSRT